MSRYAINLSSLEPHLLKYIDENTYEYTFNINEADGISFLCPECYDKNGGAIGTHTILCWTPKIPLSVSPSPGRWFIIGTDISNITLEQSSSSIQLNNGCRAHFFVRNGIVTNC
jgi:hypothetical protein